MKLFWMLSLVVLTLSEVAGAATSEWLPRVFSTSEGLPAGGVGAIAQDSRGYLWLGSDSGLIRFDGFTFRLWTPVQGPPLPQRSVQALLAAENGDLWVGLSGDGSLSRIHEGIVTNYSTRDGVPNGWIITLLQDRSGTIWAGSRSGLARFTGSRWERIHLADGDAAYPTVFALYEDRRGLLWASTSAGLLRREPSSEAFTRIMRAFDVVRAINEDFSGAIWTTDSTHAYQVIDAHSASVQRRGTHGQGTRLLRDRDNAMWVGTTDGLWRVSPRNEFTAEDLTTRAAPGTEVVTALYEDREGTMWAATRGGLVRFMKRQAETVTTAEGLVSNYVTAVETDDAGTVWIGTPSGLQQHFSGRGGATRTFVVPHGVTALARGPSKLWVATRNGLGEVRNNRYEPLVLPSGLQLSDILTMASTPDGALWFCQIGAPAPMRWLSETVSTFEHVPALRGRTCTTMAVDPAGNLWIGHGDGSLALYAAGEFQTYLPEQGMAGGSILAIAPAADGSLWLGSANGITRLRNGLFTALSDRNGLPSGNAFAIVPDGDGYLWCRFSSGVVRLHVDEVEAVARNPHHRIRYMSWGPEDGVLLPSMRHGVPTMTRGGDGRLWFKGVTGVVVIGPSRVAKSRPPVRMFVDRVVADGQPIPLADAPLTIAPQTSQLTIDYSALSLAGSPKVRLSYMLDGVDRDWVEAGQLRQAIYMHLPPGGYRFRARAMIDGFEDATTAIEMKVLAAWYETWAFYILSVTALVALIAASWVLRLRMVRARHNVVLEERGRIAREIHDTLLQSMAGIAMKLEDKATTVSADEASELRQVRQEIEHHIVDARRAISALRSPITQDRTLGTTIADAARRLVHSSASVQTVVSGKPRPIGQDIEHELLHVASEAIRNADQHARAKRILVECCYENEGIRLRVSDDGQGFDPDDAASGDHFGLRGMRERVERVGGWLEVTSHEAVGTVIEAFAVEGGAAKRNGAG